MGIERSIYFVARRSASAVERWFDVIEFSAQTTTSTIASLICGTAVLIFVIFPKLSRLKRALVVLAMFGSFLGALLKGYFDLRSHEMEIQRRSPDYCLEHSNRSACSGNRLSSAASSHVPVLLCGTARPQII